LIENIELLQIASEISKSIGNSLNIKKMLSDSLLVILKKLNCYAGFVLKLDKNLQYVHTYEQVYSIPRNIHNNDTYNLALQIIPNDFDENQLANFLGYLPYVRYDYRGNFIHLLELPGFGIIGLIKNSYDLDPNIIKFLKPILKKLAEASISCLQNDALQESERNYRSLVENLNVGVYRNTNEGAFLQANSAMAKIFGYSSVEEFLNTPVSKLYQNPKDRKNFLDIAYKQGVIKDAELKMIKTDGSFIWASCSANVTYDENGEIKFLDGVVEDITKRKEAEFALKNAHDHLELRVRERTSELIEINEKLLSEINEREKAEKALHAQEYQFSTLLENLNVGVYRNTGGPMGEFLQANSAIAQMFGYDSVNEFLKISVADLYLNPKERIDFIKDIRKNGFIKDKELYLKNKNGTPFWASCSAQAELDSNGKIKWMDGVIEDITERKVAADALKMAHINLKLAHNELENRVKERTKALLKSNTLLHEEVKERKQTEKALQIAHEDIIKAKELLEQRVQIRTSELTKANKNLIEEIKERKQTEKALEQQEDQYKNLVENINIGVYRSLLDENSSFIQANQSMLKIFGYSSLADFLNKKVSSFFQNPSDRKLLIKELIEKKLIKDAELKMLKKDGTQMWISCTAKIHFDKNGKALWVDGVNEDITERKNAEYVLKKAHEELEVRVETRTAEIRAANKNLQEEIKFRKQIELSLESHATQLTILNRLGRQIAAELELNTLLEKIAEQVMKNFNYHMFLLFTKVSGKDELALKSHSGVRSQYHPDNWKFKMGQGMVGWVGSYGRKLLANDVTKEPKYIELSPDIPTKSELTVPIIIGDKILGVLDLQSPIINSFDENDIMIMEILADQIAIAIENANLYQSVQKELTERNKAELALKISEEKFRSVVENAHNGIMIINNDFEIIYINDKICRISGYNHIEIINKDCRTFLNLENKKIVEKMFFDRRDKNKKAPLKYELVFKHKNGENRLIEISSSLIVDSQDEIRTVAQIIDITERNKMEVSLRKNEERLRSFMDSATENFILLNADLKIIEINKLAIRAFNEKKSYVIGKPLQNFIPDLIKSGRYDKYMQVIKTGTPFYIDELIAHPKFGEYTSLRAFKVNDGLGIIFTDITNYKKLEKRLREALEIKSKFLSMVSHELRTPLTALKEGISIVLDGSAGEINTIQEDFLDMAKKNVDRLHRLINDVLDITKLETGKIDYNFKETNINILINEIVSTYNSIAEEKSLHLKTELDYKLPAFKFDSDKILQVLNNLINNALKFTINGGITIKSSLKNGEVLIVFSDTGIGIKANDIPKLFHTFQQVGTNQFKQTGTTGLGLAICKEIINGHKGTIWVESKYKKGSNFCISLPLKLKNG
jgi:PAS domain S-box-containing protein